MHQCGELKPLVVETLPIDLAVQFGIHILWFYEESDIRPYNTIYTY